MEKTYDFKFTQAHLDIIGAALGEMPFKIAAPLMNEMNRQFAEQQPAPEATATE